MNEDDLQWVTNKKRQLRQFHENCRSKTTSCRELSNFSEMQINALRHHEGLKGCVYPLEVVSHYRAFNPFSTGTVFICQNLRSVDICLIDQTFENLAV